MNLINLQSKPKVILLPTGQSLFELFKCLEASSKNCFFFESLGSNKDPLSRYSILGFDSEIIIKGNRGSLKVGRKVFKSANPYELLRTMMPQHILSDEFNGGLVGYLSYEAVNFFEPHLKLKINKDFDLFKFGLFTDGVIYDHLTGEMKYFYFGKNRSKQILRAARDSRFQQAPAVRKLGTNLTPAKHSQLVKKVLKEIKAGNIFQCEVGLRRNYKISGSFLPIYESLREVNPSPYLYYLKLENQTLLGSSPELLLSVKKGQMETFPLAGTIARGKSQKEDQALAKKLLEDPKEQAEHKMLVDLHRNDLGRVAKFGTVLIKKFMDIKKFSHVQHISSEIQGLLKTSEDMFSALQSCFPGGVLTGAPKVEAIKIIARNEKHGRGPYGGAVGFFGFNGDCEFAISIRSLFANKDKAFVQASGGIVYDSNAKKEYQEIVNKLQAMEVVLNKFTKRQ
ncbi:MAG TPA: anthranilate synthase component I family protein [Candidatus Limnocylindria bacterium]|nr:anthranilate synthase component I family protein [Candidatus Limnocylindria bacterium]